MRHLWLFMVIFVAPQANGIRFSELKSVESVRPYINKMKPQSAVRTRVSTLIRNRSHPPRHPNCWTQVVVGCALTLLGGKQRLYGTMTAPRQRNSS